MAATTICIFLIFVSFNLTNSHENTTLKLLHIVFRHGDRTPLEGGINHISTKFNQTYEPYGFAELTNKGKVRSYLLGRWLRNRYRKFLGSYSSDLVEATTTFFNKTQLTLLFVLQGLFSSQDFVLKPENETYLYTTLPLNTTLIVLPNPLCVNHLVHYSKYLQTEDAKNILKKYNNVLDNLNENLNRTLYTVYNLAQIYDFFQVQKEMGLSLPYWVELILPKLESSIYDYSLLCTGTKELNQIMIGSFIKKVIETSQLKLQNDLQPQSRKLFIYSAHDINIYFFLQLFNYYPKIRPQYNSCLMIETHTIDGVDGFKVFYKANLIDEEIPINISGCGLFCPLPQFIELYKKQYHLFKTC